MREKRLFVFFILIIMGVSTVSCGRLFGRGGTAAAGGDAAKFFPSNTGNQWIYEAKTKGAPEFEIIFRVAGNENINNVDTVVYEGFISGKPFQKEYYEITNVAILAHRRVYEGGSVTANLDPPEPMLIFPLTPGRTWQWEGIISGNYRGKFDFKIAGEEEVEVPVGKFKAYKIEMTGSASDTTSVKSTRWYARDIGMVKEESTSGQTVISADLKQYTINGKTFPEGAKPAEIPSATPK